MRDCVERLGVLRAPKRTAAQLSTIQRLVRVEDVGPERIHQAPQRRRARLDYFPRNLIQINYGDFVLTKQLGHRRLPGRNAAR